MGAAESKTSLDPSSDFDSSDLYEVLGIPKEASDDEIKVRMASRSLTPSLTPVNGQRAYRQRALETHPDKNIDDIEGATKRFAKVLEAYETLTDPTCRTAYDYDRENEPASADAQQPRAADPMPGQWAAQDPQPASSGWFDWLFSGWSTPIPNWSAPADPLLRYIPEEYIARNQHLERPKGISALDIVEYVNLCGKKATWRENGRDQSLFTLLRNLFKYLAYDERRWGNVTGPIPDFGCGNSAWCPDDDQHAQHYAQDFYEYWLGFETRKTFDWVNPCRKVAKENRKIQKAVREEYNEIVRTVVDAWLRCDPRFLAHVYNSYFRTGQAPQNDFYAKFAKRCRARANNIVRANHGEQGTSSNQSQARTQTRNERKKQTQRNKARQKKSW
ncbi:hypothetical protein NLJ89_g10737 [Agrocybe chaxingu]|uniref:J domain-containing protein n=1 Tax=Agrocybe chaxingu TaxID=84603 RepID=A0A9W8MQ05_9AGAR|nr:hypothetical protein NLJ89_g10737 [Agrocybe chaxingu]